MPVSTESSISGPYTPNGATTDFAFDFKAVSAAEVVALDQDGAAISTALYSVTLDDDEGGTLSFSVAPTLAEYTQIYVVGDPALTQPSDFDNAGPSFNPAALTRALDRAAVRDLKQQRELDRAPKVAIGASPLSIGTVTSGEFLVVAGTEILSDPATPASNAAFSALSAASATEAANSNASAVAARDAAIAAKDATAALAAAASDPDANTQAALTASQQAQDAVAAYEGAFDATSTALPAALSSRVKSLPLRNAKAHDYCVSLYKFSATELRINVFDEQIDDEVGFLSISDPDYGALGGIRWPIIALDPLSSLPAGDPDGANASPILGFVEFFDTITVLDAGTYQPAPGEARINRRKVQKQQILFSKLPGSDYDEVVEVGPGRTFATPRAACDYFLDVPQPTDQTGSYAPQSKLTIGKKVAFLIDPADPNTPGLPWYDRHLFLPPNVSFVARFPGSVFFEHSPGSTRPILQLTHNHDLVDINVKNTVADSTTGPTSSACYAVHIEDHHLRLTPYPQTTFDYTQHYRVRIIGGSAVAGNAATIQPIGGAIPVNTIVEIDGVDLDVENPAFNAPLISMNNSSLTLGGGRLRVRRCRDLSGRDQSNPLVSDNASVAVQTKADFPYPNLLELEGNLNFGKIALSGFGAGGASGAGSWKLQGGDWQGNVYTSIPGDTMGYA